MPKQISISEFVAETNKRLCRPGFIKKFLHARGEPAVYLSKDKKFVVTEYPDGTIKKEPFKKPVPLKSEKTGHLPDGST